MKAVRTGSRERCCAIAFKRAFVNMLTANSRTVCELSKLCLSVYVIESKFVPMKEVPEQGDFQVLWLQVL